VVDRRRSVERKLRASIAALDSWSRDSRPVCLRLETSERSFTLPPIGHRRHLLANLRTGSETTLSAGPSGEKWYPAVSPSGSQLAFSTRVRGSERATRPIFIGGSVGRDMAGRWATTAGAGRGVDDERLLIIERFRPLKHDRRYRHTQRGAARAVAERGTIGHETLAVSPGTDVDRVRSIASGTTSTYSSPGSAISRFLSPIGCSWIARRATRSGPRTDGILYYTPIGMNPTIRRRDSRASFRR